MLLLTHNGVFFMKLPNESLYTFVNEYSAKAGNNLLDIFRKWIFIYVCVYVCIYTDTDTDTDTENSLFRHN